MFICIMCSSALFFGFDIPDAHYIDNRDCRQDILPCPILHHFSADKTNIYFLNTHNTIEPCAGVAYAKYDDGCIRLSCQNMKLLRQKIYDVVRQLVLVNKIKVHVYIIHLHCSVSPSQLFEIKFVIPFIYIYSLLVYLFFFLITYVLQYGINVVLCIGCEQIRFQLTLENKI